MALGKNIKKDSLIPSKSKKAKEESSKPKKKKSVKKAAKKTTTSKVTRTTEVTQSLAKTQNPIKAEAVNEELSIVASKRQILVEEKEVVVEKEKLDEEKELKPPKDDFRRKQREFHAPKLTQLEIDNRKRLKAKYDEDILSLRGKSVQLIVFKLGDDRYALEIDNVKEIVPSRDVSKLPHAPEYVKGVTNIRGFVMVILDLEEKFELFNSAEEINQSKEYTLVIKNDRFRVGILVNEVPTTLKIEGDRIESSSGILSNTVLDETFIKGLIKQEDDMIILLDIVELIESKDVSEIAQAVEDNN